VFGGFSAKELAVRIQSAKPEIVLAASCGIEPGRVVEYKPLLDEAIEISSHKPNYCFVVQREQLQCSLVPGRDFEWYDGIERFGKGQVGGDIPIPIVGAIDNCCSSLPSLVDAGAPVCTRGVGGPIVPALHIWHYRNAQGGAA
jgi:propionyl-CoA synthetase